MKGDTGCESIVTVFAKTDHLGANLNFEFCKRSECALPPLYSALYCASVAGSVSDIYRMASNFRGEFSRFSRMISEP